MPRLLMLARGELTRDPRARRAAAAAVAEGFEVIGVCGGGEPPLDLPGVAVVRIGTERVSTGLRRAGLGGMTDSPAVIRELRGGFRIVRATLSNLRLALAARRLGPFDVVHAHDLETLPAAQLARGAARVVYDAHELYADQEPSPPRVYRGVVRSIEPRLARHSDAVVTVGDALADELRRSLRLESRPLVVLSCPPRSDVAPTERGKGPLRALYQGSMGPGRAVIDLLDVAERAEDVELTIRLVNANLDQLRRTVSRRGLAGRVRVVDPVAPDRVVDAAADFHVGLVINRAVTRNDELVLPNKLFEYLMAGLAVVAPRLPALTPIVEGEGVGLTFTPGDTAASGAALMRLAEDEGLLAHLRERAHELAHARYNAEAQAHTLAYAWRVP